MLIRSQNHDMLINFAHVAQIDIVKLKRLDGFYYAISAEHGEECYVISAGTCRIGEYSTQDKARRVLDMIGDAYKVFVSGGVMPEYVESYITFQMPEDEKVDDDLPFA